MYDTRNSEIETSLEAELNALYAKAEAERAVQMEERDNSALAFILDEGEAA